jgi:hypothetical protein
VTDATNGARTIKLNPTIRQTAEAVKRSIMVPFEAADFCMAQ